MNNVVILPIIVPLLCGIISIFFIHNRMALRWLTTTGLLLSLGISLYLLQQVSVQGIQTLQAGNWAPPFGIVFVADMFAVLLVVTTHLVGLACLFFSFRSIGEGRRKHYYYAFFMFLIGGVNGAFLTGDVFNLFVFFEVLLIASYVLVVLGGTREQLRESLKYVVINVTSSALFVVSVALLYGMVGTLNMAHLAERVAAVEQTGMLTVVALLFFTVFAIKGALFPLYFWLPGSYAVPPTPVAALFAGLLTKVGLYAIFRFFTLIFLQDPPLTHAIILFFAVATMAIGVVGAIASNNVKHILAYNIVSAVGFILMGLGFYNEAALAGSVFYVIHDIVIKVCLFLLGGIIIGVAGTANLQNMSGLIKHHAALGWLYLTAALSLAGVPPLSGFIGKVLLIQGGFDADSYWVVGLSLLVSLLILYSVIRIFVKGIWGVPQLASAEEHGPSRRFLMPAAFLVFVSVVLGVGAELFYPYIWTAAEQMMDPSMYIESVNPKE